MFVFQKNKIGARITEEYVQVQVVNVSTGEFEGNVTVNL